MKVLKVIGSFVEGKFRKIKVSAYGGANQWKQVTPYGYESVPNKKANAVLISDAERDIIIGYIQAALDLKEGESCIFSKDANGVVKASFTSRVDGSCEINGTGDFAVRFNELEKGYNDLKKWAEDHTHIVTAADGVVAGTYPVSGTIPKSLIPCTASISDAKIDTIKVPKK